MSTRAIFYLIIGLFVSLAACDNVSPPNYGCTNPLALNYDPEATLDDGHCEFDPSLSRGCTDTLASNYDPNALIDDCHCDYDSVRTILLEDYTGFKCPNCPRAAITLKELECIYGKRIVPLAVHVSQTFAAPSNNADGSFSTDFRTDIGNTYDAEFGNSLFLPNGLLNRREFNGLFPQLHTDWPGIVSNILAQPAEALVDIDVTYDEGSREATAAVRIRALTDLNASPYRISVLLSEDSIVDWQIDGDRTPPEIPDYVHMHVLRDGFTTAWGDVINGGAPLSNGFETTLNFSLVIDPEYVDHNCNVVAFVHRDDTKEVIQADYESVIHD